MIGDMRRMLDEVERARPVVVCHADDQAAVGEAVQLLGWWTLAPRVVVSRWAKAGELVVIPRPGGLWL